MDIFPAWRDACLGTLEEKIAKFADPARLPAMLKAIDEQGGGFGAARYPLAEIKVNWISSDAQCAAAEGDLRGLDDRRDRRPRGEGPCSTRCSTSRWPPS